MPLRWVSAVAATLALVAVSVRASTVAARPPVPAPCSASALTAHLTNIAPGGVVAFGCEGSWAYAWLVVGSGAQRVGVTELLRFADATWRAVPRVGPCRPGALPAVVYQRACFSN